MAARASAGSAGIADIADIADVAAIMAGPCARPLPKMGDDTASSGHRDSGMTRPIVFISHSCRDTLLDRPADQLGPDEAAWLTAEVRESLEHARNVRGAIKNMINCELGADTWVDVERLPAGEDWQPGIARALEACHAAVVLLGEQSLESAWVRHEVENLTSRKLRDPSFRLVVVLLVPVRPADLSRQPALGLTRLGLLTQFIEETGRGTQSTETLVNAVRTGLEGLRASLYAQTDEGRWMERVDTLLRAETLATWLWEELPLDEEPAGGPDSGVAGGPDSGLGGGSGGDPVSVPGGGTFLTNTEMAGRRTAYLFEHGLDLRTVKALAEACRLAGYQNTAALVDELLPLWVGPEDAAAILEASTDVEATWLVVLDTDHPGLGKNYAERAVNRRQDIPVEVLPPPRSYDEDVIHSTFGDFMRDNFSPDWGLPTKVWDRGRVRIVPGRTRAPATAPAPAQAQAPVARRRRELIETDGPQFVLVPRYSLPDIRSSALRIITEEWPEVTAVLLSDDPGSTGRDSLPASVSVCRLPLDHHDEGVARRIYTVMCKISDRPDCGFGPTRGWY